jgi:hypothetical protein
VFVTNDYGSASSLAAKLVVVSPPQVGPARFMADGNVGFGLTVTPDVTWRIQAASEIGSPMNWVTLTNLSSATGLLQFSDLAATNHPQRFYRAVWP